VFPIAVPPLRERAEDIPDLVRHFLARIAAEEGKRVRSISGEALALLAHHRWPGNVRQLENAVFRAVVLAEGDSIGVNEFPQIAAQIAGEAATTQPSVLAEPVRAPAMFEVPQLLDFGAEVAPLNGLAHDALGLLDTHGDVRPLEEIEAEVIRFAIAHYRGQMSEVARRLQIGRSTLYRKLENLGLAERSHEERKEPAGAH
jgi:DNA-binding NtrC family response regulator